MTNYEMWIKTPLLSVSLCPTRDSTNPTRACFHLRGILTVRKTALTLRWPRSLHSFSNTLTTEFSTKRFSAVTIQFNSVALFKPQV